MKVVPLRQDALYKFAYKSQYLEGKKKVFGLIVICNRLNEKDYEVSVLTEFLAEEYSNCSSRTEKKRAYQLIAFLNYLIEVVHIKEFRDIQISHGEDFLNNHLRRDIGKHRGKGIIQEYEKILIKFYKYLFLKGLIPRNTYESFINPLTGNEKKNPFGVRYPDEVKKIILHDIPEKYLDVFLKIAVKVAYPIAFGIYLQIYGGLRLSEVVSIRFEDATMVGIGGEYGFQVSLKKGRIVRPDIKNHVVSTVKKERIQHVDPIDPFSQTNYGLKMFYEHTSTYSCTDNSGAIFVNPRKTEKYGKAMTPKNYARYFNRVRDEFCRQLINSSIPQEREYGKYLVKLNWSTHICRGIFTNMKARYLKNAVQVQYARGDGSLESAIEYYEKNQVIKNSEASHRNQIQFVRDLAAKKSNEMKELKRAVKEVKQIILMDNEMALGMESPSINEESVVDFFDSFE